MRVNFKKYILLLIYFFYFFFITAPVSFCLKVAQLHFKYPAYPEKYTGDPLEPWPNQGEFCLHKSFFVCILPPLSYLGEKFPLKKIIKKLQ